MADLSTSGWDVVSITDLDTMNTIINTDRLYPSPATAVAGWPETFACRTKQIRHLPEGI